MNPEIFNKAIYNAIDRLIYENNLSIVELEKLAGLSENALHKSKRAHPSGKRRVPRWTTIISITDAVGMPVSKFAKWVDDFVEKESGGFKLDVEVIRK